MKMDFYEKPDLENIRKDRENRAYLHNYYHLRFLTGTIGMILVIAICFFNARKVPEIPSPSPHDYEIAHTLTTIEGRETAVDEKYDGAKIIRERTYGKDIISVFEVDYMYSFCVFEALEDGYWLEYCGDLFPKTELVKGTIYLGDNTHEYDIYLQYENIYSHLVATRTYKKHQKYSEKDNIRFDENGIGITKIDYNRFHYFKPRIEAYDAEGNSYILDNGGIF